MGVALRAAGTERDAELGAREVAREPCEVGVGDGVVGLTLAGAHDHDPRFRRPRAAGGDRLVADEHDLEPVTLGGGAELADLLGLGGGPDERDDAVDLVEQDLHRARVEV